MSVTQVNPLKHSYHIRVLGFIFVYICLGIIIYYITHNDDVHVPVPTPVVEEDHNDKSKPISNIKNKDSLYWLNIFLGVFILVMSGGYILMEIYFNRREARAEVPLWSPRYYYIKYGGDPSYKDKTLGNLYDEYKDLVIKRKGLINNSDEAKAERTELNNAIEKKDGEISLMKYVNDKEEALNVQEKMYEFLITEGHDAEAAKVVKIIHMSMEEIRKAILAFYTIWKKKEALIEKKNYLKKIKGIGNEAEVEKLENEITQQEGYIEEYKSQFKQMLTEKK